jgi:hypothetical protein
MTGSDHLPSFPELSTMATHLLPDDLVPDSHRVLHLLGPSYTGRHRRPCNPPSCQAGSLVVEPASTRPSSVIRQVDGNRALVRHVGTCDDHIVPIDDLRPFADGSRVRVGYDFTAAQSA